MVRKMCCARGGELFCDVRRTDGLLIHSAHLNCVDTLRDFYRVSAAYRHLGKTQFNGDTV